MAKAHLGDLKPFLTQVSWIPSPLFLLEIRSFEAIFIQIFFSLSNFGEIPMNFRWG